MRKRKILFPITNKIHYARQRMLLDLLRNHPQFELQLVLGGAVLVEKYGEQFFPAIRKAGFRIDEALFNSIDGGNHVSMAKTAGLTALEFANVLYKLNPDIVLIRGDRFEQLAIAMVAAYLNKTVAHIEGGDVSGTIDESVRHAITKLAHVHFVTNQDARRRVIQMGEDPASVFEVGSLDVEFAAHVRKRPRGETLRRMGTGQDIDIRQPFVTVVHHPVTTETDNRFQIETLLKAVDELDIQTLWFWPNNDAGTDEMAKAIRVWRELGKSRHNKIKFVTDVLPEDFITLLRRSRCLIGNSSSAIKECSYLGVPAVNIGTRQQGRLRGPNVEDVPCKKRAIQKAIRAQLVHGAYPPSDLYYRPGASAQIVRTLERVPLQTQKRFFDL